MTKGKKIICAIAALFVVSAVAAPLQSNSTNDLQADSHSQMLEQSLSVSDASSSASVSDAPSSSPAIVPEEGTVEEHADPIDNPDFSITFLDVGQGDAAVVRCDGHYMIVDGGTPDSSRLMYTYCKEKGITNADYMVASHPDTDHVGGISGALQVISVGRAFCAQVDADKRGFQSMKRYLASQNVSIEVPAKGSALELGSATVQVVESGSDFGDNGSVVLRIVYGNTSFLLVGDASEDEEKSCVSSGALLESTLLKVSHHGSASSTCYRFLRAVNPQIAVISVGKDNGYGHPTETVLSRLRDCGSKVYRTDLQGDIIATSDGSVVSVSVEKNADADTFASREEAQKQETQGIAYVGNKNSRKFHEPTCKTLPKESNRVVFDTRQAAIDAGYTPCGNCKP